MNKSKIIYLFIGILFVLIIFLSINAVNDTITYQFKYEHNLGQGALTILDKETGKVKVYELSPRNAKLLYEIDYNSK